MIVPENPKALAELDAQIKRNLAAGDWGPPTVFSSNVFVPMDEHGNILQEADLANEQ